MTNQSNRSTLDEGAPEDDFGEQIAQMVTDQAPRLFAVVQEYGEQEGAEIIAWGMADSEGAYLVTTDGKSQYVLEKPENALWYLGCGPGTTARLVWVDQPVSRMEALTAFTAGRNCG